MSKQAKKLKRIVLILVASILLFAIFLVLPINPKLNPLSKLGLTFSPKAATALGLDWKEIYKKLLVDLQPDVIRIPIYWDILEPVNNEFHFEDFDYQLDLLEGTDIEVILAIGHKLPRWPECHLPNWVSNLDNEAIEMELQQMIETVVKNYRNNSRVITWQVQNEVLFTFGECPEWSSNRKRLKSLITSVQKLAPEDKVATSDSGELSFWLKTSTLPIDTLAISLYRSVYNPDRGGYFYWPVNPYYYKIHAFLVRPFVREIIISELQLEPWGPAPVQDLSDEEVLLSITPEEIDIRLDFAQRTGATTILAWGVEWWYYMQEVRGNSEFLQSAQKYFNQ